MMSENYSPQRLHAFDLDGTLVDNKALVMRAYSEVGVAVPEGAWGKPWRAWLDDPLLHHKKNVRYLELIEQGFIETTSAYDYVVKHNIHPVVLTGASDVAAAAILERLFPRGYTLVAEMSMADKYEYLGYHTEIDRYLDDSAETIDALMDLVGNDNFRPVLYHGQSVDQLEKELEL